MVIDVGFAMQLSGWVLEGDGMQHAREAAFMGHYLLTTGVAAAV